MADKQITQYEPANSDIMTFTALYNSGDLYELQITFALRKSDGEHEAKQFSIKAATLPQTAQDYLNNIRDAACAKAKEHFGFV